MKIGLLLPSALSAKIFRGDRVFAPLFLARSLADGLTDRGHSVCFYTSADIETKARIIPGDADLTDKPLTYFQFGPETRADNPAVVRSVLSQDFESGLLLSAYRDGVEGRLEILHVMHGFGAHYFTELTKFPTVFTLHDPLPARKDTLEYRRLTKFLHHNYVSISDSQRHVSIKLNFVATVHNGIDLNDFPYVSSSGEYLIHFGRIMPEKGTDVAIEVARQTNKSLHIAASPVLDTRSREYYDKQIAPYLDDKTVRLTGFLEGKTKAGYIGNAAACILPLDWEEPFGLVMIEAMACGTPVIAYNRGSVSEIVRDGVTGFIVEPPEAARSYTSYKSYKSYTIKKKGLDGLIEAVSRIGEIDRAACRQHVAENFTVEKMVEGYERIYKQIISKRT